MFRKALWRSYIEDNQKSHGAQGRNTLRRTRKNLRDVSDPLSLPENNVSKAASSSLAKFALELALGIYDHPMRPMIRMCGGTPAKDLTWKTIGLGLITILGCSIVDASCMKSGSVARAQGR
uniref:Uncharacterized protein n=1 Tax=Glossina brevipalpis TaxID=37001 RepID=A0A1A9X0E6_9MUSC